MTGSTLGAVSLIAFIACMTIDRIVDRICEHREVMKHGYNPYEYEDSGKSEGSKAA